MKNIIPTTTLAAVLIWSGVSLANLFPVAESTGYNLNKVGTVEKRAGRLFQHNTDGSGMAARFNRMDGARLLSYVNQIHPGQKSPAQWGRLDQGETRVIGQIELPRKKWLPGGSEDWWLSGREAGGNGTPTPTPEPATMLLLGTGIAALAGRMKRRNRKGAYSL